MQKAVRLAFLIAGVLCALLVVALLAVNLYVQSAPTQARIQDELSQRLGATLRIQRISLTPWWGLKLTGITMPQDSASGVAGDFLHAQTFRLRVQVPSLFSRRLVIKEVSLIKPTVVWAQNADGKWRLPSTLPAAKMAAVAPAPTDQSAPAPVTSAPSPSAESAAEADQVSHFTPEVRRVRLLDGSFRFLDAEKKPVASFEGVRFQSSLRNATALRGDASIAKISLRGRVFLEQLQSPLAYDPQELHFSAITAHAAGGDINGSFRMRPDDPASPFTVVVDLHGLDADRLIREAQGPGGMLRGRIEGHLEANGQTADPNALRGAGEIHLRDGQVQQYSLLVALGQLLQVDELRQLRFDDAHVRFHIEPGVIMVDDLLLSSANIRLSAVGTISFDGKLRLESRLAINESIRQRLFRAIRDNFEPADEPGYTAVNFRVSGTVDRPKSNLVEKLVGSELKDLSSVISGFLGGGKRERQKKKPRENTAPVEASTPGIDASVDPAPTPEAAEPAPTP